MIDKHAFSQKDQTIKACAVIVAAGKSDRMGFDKLKADVSGMKVLTRSVLAFELNEKINEIIVVVQSDTVEYWSSEFKNHSFKKIKNLLPGGSTRQQSVCIGVGEVSV